MRTPDRAKKPTYVDGLINLGFQAAATTAKSVATNVLTGKRWDSRIDLGIGDFTLHFRDGELSTSVFDNLGNFITIYNYGRGFKDVIDGNSTPSLDKLTFSPRFTESRKSFLNLAAEGKVGITRKILTRANETPGGVNKAGAEFIRYSQRNNLDLLVHEGLHSIDSRLRGNTGDVIYSRLHPKNNTPEWWWETRLRSYYDY